MGFLSSGFNILLIVLGFGVLIFIHELGHFIAAKWAGIRTEAFAIGMGPVAVAWRKGIGFRFRSTAPDYEKRVRQFLADDAHRVKPKEETEAGDASVPPAELYRIGDKLGLGETEYSLRWLPLGGFVKMLGQEDANPNAVSDDPRSYSRCPVGKRMIVVSAGVIMNLLLACALFIAAFMVGVRFEAPVLGDVSTTLAAGRTKADNATALGVTTIGIQPGDEVISINGEPAKTFADLQIASAMSKPDVPIKLTVKRPGIEIPLQFTLMPQKDPGTGLLSIGVTPGSSTTLLKKADDELLAKALRDCGLAQAGVLPGMRMIKADGHSVQTFEQFQQQVRQSGGKPVETEWTALDKDGRPIGPIVRAVVAVRASYSIMRYPKDSADELQNFEKGLLGMTPLVKLDEIPKGENSAVLREGDVVLRINSIDAPRMADFRREVNQHPRSQVHLQLLRDEKPIEVIASVDRHGKLNVLPTWDFDRPYIAQPIEAVGDKPSEPGEPVSIGGDAPAPQIHPTPVAGLKLFGLSRIDAIGGRPVKNWADIRRELRGQTEAARAAKEGASIAMQTTLPTPGKERETVQLKLSPEDVVALHDLAWETNISPALFEPVYTIRSAGGSPFKAVAMGFEETKKLVMMTYLTIDRLFRGSVGVEQLRGPVGIVHIGSKVADRGFTYLIFFLAMISVNLAVINFLPMPIVDGGLFLFLVYEKFKGRPPSIAFQNAATVAGLVLIGTAFLVTFYNDVLRLIS